jgi:hypothetical protein
MADPRSAGTGNKDVEVRRTAGPISAHEFPGGNGPSLRGHRRSMAEGTGTHGEAPCYATAAAKDWNKSPGNGSLSRHVMAMGISPLCDT